MYVLLEYLTYLGVVSALGLIFFVAVLLGLVAKVSAAQLKTEASAKIAEIARRVSLRHLPDLKSWRHHPPPAHSH